MSLPACPACGLENTYTDGDQYMCPDCFHEWPLTAAEDDGEGDARGPRCQRHAARRRR
jgi:protein PhnA